MALVLKRKPIELQDFIGSLEFSKMHGLTLRQLSYRLLVGHVEPMPVKFGTKLVFDPDAKIVIPPPIRAGGRPKGSTIANGARKPGVRSTTKKILWKRRKPIDKQKSKG